MQANSSHLQGPPWVYQPHQFWDQQEILEEYNQNPVPSADPPQQIRVNLLGEEKRTISMELTATDQAIQGRTVSSLELTATEQTVQAPNFHLKYNMIRYVTTNCRALCTEEHRFVIMVSTRRVGEEDASIFNMYIVADNAMETLSILNFFQFHIFKYLKEATKEADPSVILQFLRPVLMQEFQVKLHRRQEKKTLDEMRIVVLDQECFALYEKPYQESPDDVMFFWREFYNKSCSKVSKIHSMDVVFFQSQHLFVVIECKREGRDDTKELEAGIKESVKPKPWRAFYDAAYMLKVLKGVDVSMDAMDFQEDPAPQRPIVPPIPEGQAIELGEEDNEKLNTLNREIRDGLESSDKEWKTMWQNRQMDLEKENQKYLLLDHDRLDLQPDSVDDFLRAVYLIQEQLFRFLNYKNALAITLQVQRIYMESRVQRLRTLVDETALELLRKIFARGSVHSPQLPGAVHEALHGDTNEEGLEYESGETEPEMEEDDDDP